MNKYAPPRSSSNGLTLLEMLVVLIITSLVAALLMQGFASILDMRGRLLAHLEYQDRIVHSNRWFRQSVRGLVAELPDHAHRVFHGTSENFRGTSVAGPDQRSGITQLIEWRIEKEESGAALIYLGEFGHRFTALKLEEGKASFFYLDAEGTWHSAWPPQQLRAATPQLPRAVRLQARYGNEVLLWLAAVPAHPEPRRALLPLDQLGL